MGAPTHFTVVSWTFHGAVLFVFPRKSGVRRSTITVFAVFQTGHRVSCVKRNSILFKYTFFFLNGIELVTNITDIVSHPYQTITTTYLTDFIFETAIENRINSSSGSRIMLANRNVSICSPSFKHAFTQLSGVLDVDIPCNSTWKTRGAPSSKHPT